jgi:FtsZ-interacting cell division protein YlmF
MYENNLAGTVAAWGPSLVLLFATLLAARLVYNAQKRKIVREKYRIIGHTSPTPERFNELGSALESATTLNAYSIHTQNDPSVHLGAAVRFTPLDYQGSVYEIMQRFREGRVVSIDLGKMDSHQAARLVDFCSGMTAMGSGWIFRVTDSVIVLTPLT